jgi:hypothetical protein
MEAAFADFEAAEETETQHPGDECYFRPSTT